MFLVSCTVLHEISVDTADNSHLFYGSSWINEWRVVLKNAGLNMTAACSSLRIRTAKCKLRMLKCVAVFVAAPTAARGFG